MVSAPATGGLEGPEQVGAPVLPARRYREIRSARYPLGLPDRSDATVYVIGQGRALRAPALQQLMRRLAEGSGGRAFFSDNDARLQGIFEEIVDDLRHQYLLAYPAADHARDGEWHRIRVDVPGRNYAVRARLGYRIARADPK